MAFCTCAVRNSMDSVRQHGHGALVAIFTDPCEVTPGLDGMKAPFILGGNGENNSECSS